MRLLWFIKRTLMATTRDMPRASRNPNVKRNINYLEYTTSIMIYLMRDEAT